MYDRLKLPASLIRLRAAGDAVIGANKFAASGEEFAARQEEERRQAHKVGRIRV